MTFCVGMGLLELEPKRFCDVLVAIIVGGVVGPECGTLIHIVSNPLANGLRITKCGFVS